MNLKFFKDEKGSFVIETAVIIPIIICIICASLLLTIKKYRSSAVYIKEKDAEYASIRRAPKDIINNTDLVFEFIDKIKSYSENNK